MSHYPRRLTVTERGDKREGTYSKTSAKRKLHSTISVMEGPDTDIQIAFVHPGS